MPRHKVIFDTDPGIDDAMALLFLDAAPEVELLGITTVLGNGDIETTTRNALYLKQRFGLAAPVFRGAGAPLSGEAGPAPTFVHGRNGLGDIDLGAPPGVSAEARPAFEAIVEAARRYPGEVTLVAVGRMTNLALALRADPGVASLIRQVVIMGGAFGGHGHAGNVSPVAEANMHGDPQAADEVFAAAWPVTVVGLDVTQEARMSDAFLREVAAQGGARGRFVWDISRFYADFHRGMGLDSIYVHDSSAVAWLLRPSLFTTRPGAIRVVVGGIAHGQTIQKPDGKRFPPGAWDGRPSHSICTGVDAEGLRGLYLRTLAEAASA